MVVHPRNIQVNVFVKSIRQNVNISFNYMYIDGKALRVKVMTCFVIQRFFTNSVYSVTLMFSLTTDQF